ncbi:MAG: hypothetical protein FVQ79_02885 [Planctomycetes bacterium]|nr:hypothetical protein [Planctomycetota bacterium]
MTKTLKTKTASSRRIPGRVILAAALYAALAVYLFWPYFNRLTLSQYILPLNFGLAATGCFVLSKRWISSFSASLLAGALYAFSPFALSFAAYHPAATIPLALLPWLFYPAAYWQRWPAFSFLTSHNSKNRTPKRQTDILATITTAIFSILPLAVIVLFFILASPIARFYPLALIELKLENFTALAIPLAIKSHEFPFSFYHIPNIALLMGIFVYLAGLRITTLLLFLVTLCLSFADPILSTPPVIWALTPMLFGAILIGLGLQALCWAARPDSKWLLACTITAAVLALASYLAGHRHAAAMHALAALLAAIILCIANSKMRLHPLRWTLIYSLITADILLSAATIIDKIF